MKTWRWLTAAAVLAAAGALFLISPRAGAVAFILLALGAVAVFAFRLL